MTSWCLLNRSLNVSFKSGCTGATFDSERPPSAGSFSPSHNHRLHEETKQKTKAVVHCFKLTADDFKRN